MRVKTVLDKVKIRCQILLTIRQIMNKKQNQVQRMNFM